MPAVARAGVPGDRGALPMSAQFVPPADLPLIPHLEELL